MSIQLRIPDIDYWRSQIKCATACPVGTDAGRYAQLIGERRYEEAYRVLREPNPFASVCARICAAPCEDACRRGLVDAPVALRALKRFVTERCGAESLHPGALGSPATTGVLAMPSGKVAVIGAGPAGLAAAHDLALLGYCVTVFEAGPEPGGMMRFGIPEYRLPRGVIRAEIDRILSLGVVLELSRPLTPQFGLAELRKAGFDAVFISVGVSKGRDLQIPGVELDGVIKAVDYLLNVNRGFRADLGRNVVVIGGGFVAFDAARTALRVSREEDLEVLSEIAGESDAVLKDAFDSARAAIRGGAAHVTMVSLESFEEMPVLRTTQGHEEFEETRREGVEFLTRRGPKRFIGERRLQAIELRKVLSVFDEKGRFAPQYQDDDVITVVADACILAIGQRADLSFLHPEDGIELTPAGTIAVDRSTLATSARGVFAGGDVAFGPRNLIEAVANGKRAAHSIHEYLAGNSARPAVEISIEKIPARFYQAREGFELLAREAPPTVNLDRRTGISEVEIGYDEPTALRQAARCLVCHIQTIYDSDKCVLCGRCVDVCPQSCLAIVPVSELDLSEELRERIGSGIVNETLSAMVKDDEQCIRCGLCAIRCPTEAMTMERLWFEQQPAMARREACDADASRFEVTV